MPSATIRSIAIEVAWKLATRSLRTLRIHKVASGIPYCNPKGGRFAANQDASSKEMIKKTSPKAPVE